MRRLLLTLAAAVGSLAAFPPGSGESKAALRSTSNTAAAGAASQIPDRFTNLQVLPADISRQALVGAMRGYAGSLGVRCDHCHVGGDPETLEGFDFASDDKETKRVARAMIRMVGAINSEYLPATGRSEDSLLAVGCYTCHHGVNRPESLRTILLTTFAENGIEAVIARYEELRERYYGRAAYDFGRTALSSVAERIGRRHGDLEATERLLLYNIERFPDWDYHFFLLGQTRSRAGDLDGAREALRRALELSPGNSWYQTALDELGQQ